MIHLGKALEQSVANMTDSPSEPYHCRICGRLVPKKQIEVLGKVRYVQPCCECEAEAYEQEKREREEAYRREMIERKFAISKLGKRFQNSKFETFDWRPGTEKALQYAKEFVENFDNNEGEGLLIWGVSGNGKSHLAAAISHALKAKEKTVVFQDVPELLERIRSTFNRDSKETETVIMDAFLDCDLLVMDDIGAEKVTDWVLNVLFRIIDGRNRRMKPIVYTTNFNPAKLMQRFMIKDDEMSEIQAKRIVDRITGNSLIVENKGTSYRMEQARNRHKNGG